jgi:ADP-heptose:LPS heptosyltransferase
MATLFIGPTRLGDGILASGLLGWLCDTYPSEAITLACGAPAALALREAPGVAHVHLMHKRARGGHWLDLWRAVRGRRWTRVVDLRRSALPWLLRADVRHSVPFPGANEHRVALLSRTLGLPPQPPRVWLSPAHRDVAGRLLPKGAPVLALGIGTNWMWKTWPAEAFATLAARLTAADGPLPGATLLLVGGEAERTAASPVQAAFPAHRILDALGLDVPATAALLEGAHLFVGNDSAMMHLAAATGARTVGLFGPTQDAHYGPWGSNALVVRTPEGVGELLARRDENDPTQSLMGSLEPATVEAAIRARWAGFEHTPRG